MDKTRETSGNLTKCLMKTRDSKLVTEPTFSAEISHDDSDDGLDFSVI